MWKCYNCGSSDLPEASGMTSSLVLGEATCRSCGVDNKIPVGNMIIEAQDAYETCAIWEEGEEEGEKKMNMEKIKKHCERFG